MDVEAGAASVLNGLGFSKDSLKVGDIVTVTGNPARQNPDAHMLGKDLYKKADGAYLPLYIGSKSIYEAKTNATTTTIEGTWFSPMRSFTGVMGAMGRAPKSEKGQAAAKAANPNVSSQADCIPIGEPVVMVYPVANNIKVSKDKVVIRTDWMDTERTVYLDDRKHPAPTQTFLHGHSIGHWEGKTLVVETTNFKEHQSGLSTTMPSSTQKKLIERFELAEDGKTLKYSGYGRRSGLSDRPGSVQCHLGVPADDAVLEPEVRRADRPSVHEGSAEVTGPRCRRAGLQPRPVPASPPPPCASNLTQIFRLS